MEKRCSRCKEFGKEFSEKRSKYWCVDCCRKGYREHRAKLKARFPRGTLTRCPRCFKVKPSWVLNVCELCAKDEGKKYSYARLAKMLKIYFNAKNKPCSRCRKKYHLAAMEFHHRDRKTKEGNVYSFIYQPGKLIKEIKKCDVVCANCHAIITYEENRLNGSSLYYPYEALEHYLEERSNIHVSGPHGG